MTKIKDGRFYEGLNKGVNSVTDRSYFCADSETGSDEYATGFEYLMMTGNENHAWRDYYDENDYGIDPYDYETEDDYLEAVEELY